MKRTIIGLFDTLAAAQNAVDDLIEIDIPVDDISVVWNDAQPEFANHIHIPEKHPDDIVPPTEGAMFGAAMGGLTGVLLSLGTLPIAGIAGIVFMGPIVAGLTGALTGAAIGGLIGALVKSGVPATQASQYAASIEAGKILVIVFTTDDFAQQVENIFIENESIKFEERTFS